MMENITPEVKSKMDEFYRLAAFHTRANEAGFHVDVEYMYADGSPDGRPDLLLYEDRRGKPGLCLDPEGYPYLPDADDWIAADIEQVVPVDWTNQ